MSDARVDRATRYPRLRSGHVHRDSPPNPSRVCSVARQPSRCSPVRSPAPTSTSLPHVSRWPAENSTCFRSQPPGSSAGHALKTPVNVQTPAIHASWIRSARPTYALSSPRATTTQLESLRSTVARSRVGTRRSKHSCAEPLRACVGFQAWSSAPQPAADGDFYQRACRRVIATCARTERQLQGQSKRD